MKHEPIKPTARDLLSRIIADIAALNAMGDLADAPTDWLNGLDDGDAAARWLVEWLDGSEERAREEARENRPSIYASELAQIAYWGRLA